MAAGKSAKVGPNDKCHCGSGAKAKKCCQGLAVHASQPGQCHVLPGSAEELRNMAKEAERNEDLSRAQHLYTMAVNSVATGMPRNQDGVASDADLLKCETASEGKLSQVLAERAHVSLRQGKASAAIEDAETCVRANPQSEDGYRVLVQAYEAAGAAPQVQLEVYERGLAACPDSEYLVTGKWRMKKAVSEKTASAFGQNNADSNVNDALAETQRLADDASDPRRAAAAADWGSILATGAHGVEKDVAQAERYLRIGADGGEMVAQRNLGLLLLERGRPVEAARALEQAAALGDEQAVEVLQHLGGEAAAKRKEALARLEAMAADGDPQAKAMLKDFRALEE